LPHFEFPLSPLSPLIEFIHNSTAHQMNLDFSLHPVELRNQLKVRFFIELVSFNPNPDFGLDMFEYVNFVGSQKGDGLTLKSITSCPTYSMHIVCDSPW